MTTLVVNSLLVVALLCCTVAAHAQEYVRASWYGPGFEGKLMAFRGTFRSSDPTIAAHRTLPRDTVLLLRNLKNDRRLVVVVKDRGPYVSKDPDRKLDLSRAAAEYLDFIDDGVAWIEMHVGVRM